MPLLDNTQEEQSPPSMLSSLMDSPKQLCAAFLCLFAFPVVIYIANTLNQHHLEKQAQEHISTVLQSVSERIGVINTVLGSMVGLHDFATELDNDNFQHFSDVILKNAAYIRHLGGYETIPHAQRDAFESRMSHNGYSDFSIAELDDNGRFVARRQRQHYYPVTTASPLHSIHPGLPGTDLGTVPGLIQAMESGIADDLPTILALPALWPLQGDLIAFRAAHDHSLTSNDSHSRAKLNGFWLTLDIDKLLSDLSTNIDAFDIGIELINNETQSLVYSRQARSRQPLFFSHFYQRQSTSDTWFVSSNTMLMITFERAAGMTLTALVFTAMSLISIVLISCLYTTHVLSHRKTEAQRLASMQSLFIERDKAHKTLNSVQDAIITLGTDLNIVHINPAAAIKFNTRANLVIGQPLTTLARFKIVGDNSRTLDTGLELSGLPHNTKKEFDVAPLDSCEEDFVFRLSLSSSHDHEDNIIGHVMVLRDISHERHLSRKLAYQANYDALTGCTNRYFFEQSLDRLISEMPTSGLTHTLCYMDLDQFKVVNDTCGHRAGDQLLIELTMNMQFMIRDQDILSRLGGDEFGIILVDVDRAKATRSSQRIFDFFQKFNFTHQGNTFSITASIGVVHIDQQCANTKDIMASADIACYAAKDSGRNSMSVYSKSDEGMAERSEQLNWLPRLQTALNNNEFRLHAQAVASLDPKHADQPITHFEFLLRLANSDGTEVTPWQFIKAAERYDLMRDIDRWVIRNALQTVAEHADGAGKDCSFSINLSGQSAADPGLKSFIQEQMALHKVDPTRIWFELTETAAISHFSIAVDLIKNIRTIGAKVALDDFGSGLSSFGYLKNLPVDVIKIDGQFIKEIAHNPFDREMVRAIHSVGESMNIITVAEFVEDQAIVDELVRIGVNYAQGYHIGRPLPVAEAIKSLDIGSKAA